MSGTRRICFVQTELLGHVRAGGIATATSYISRLLGRAGFDVTLLDAAPEDQVISVEWMERYGSDGVKVRRLDRSDAISPASLADTTRVYRQLRDESYDAIVFQDWLGVGFVSMSAKRAGLAFGTTRLVHIVHGPSEWLWEANQDLNARAEEFIIAHAERRAAEQCDTVVGPSRYLVGWMRDAGWCLPVDQRIIPYATPALLGEVQLPDPSRWSPSLIRELVFFGRYEERKGVRVFIDALNRLPTQLLAGMKVTLLGRATPYSVPELLALFDPAVLDVIDGPHFVTDLDSHHARAYLRVPGRVALIPSLVDNSPNVVIECIEDGVSFLASSTGGIPELVAAADRDRTMFTPEPAAMAARLRTLLVEGVTPPPAQPAYAMDKILPAWEAIVEPVEPAVAGARPAHQRLAEPPLVSAVVPHFAQPDLVRHAIDSLVNQDYPNLEIVVVDDGTPSTEAFVELQATVAAVQGRPIRLLRQENRYLGAARNTGTEAAAGELVIYLDDDDVAEPTYVSAMVDALQRTDAAAATCAIRTFDDDGGTLDGPDSGTWVFTGDAVHLAPIFNLLGGAACIVRRSAWSAVGGFHERHGVGHEDWDFLARLILGGHRVVSIPEALYRYRVRKASMIRNTSRYRNMQPVFESMAAALPRALRTWPMQIAASQVVLERTWADIAKLVRDKSEPAEPPSAPRPAEADLVATNGHSTPTPAGRGPAAPYGRSARLANVAADSLRLAGVIGRRLRG